MRLWSRDGIRPSFAASSPSSRTEGAGKAGWPLHPGLPRKQEFARARKPQVQTVTTGLPCAVGYGLLRALPGELCLIATVAIAQPLEPHDRLTPSLSAPEPHDFIRPRRCRSPHDISPSTTFRTTSAAIARRPFSRGGTGWTIRQIRISENRNIFARRG